MFDLRLAREGLFLAAMPPRTRHHHESIHRMKTSLDVFLFSSRISNVKNRNNFRLTPSLDIFPFIRVILYPEKGGGGKPPVKGR
jgi:hypothetical protein